MGEIISQDVSGRLKRSLGHYTDLTSLTSQLAENMNVSKNRFSILNYGAKTKTEDATFNNITSINQAIDAAFNAGGGIVVIPFATYTVNPGTSSIRLKSNVEIHAFGSTLERIGTNIVKRVIENYNYGGVGGAIVDKNMAIRDITIIGTGDTLGVSDQGHAIGFFKADSIILENIKTDKTNGDGIAWREAHNISLRNIKIGNFGRNGISPTSGLNTVWNDVDVYGSAYLGANGKGIDCENNSETEWSSHFMNNVRAKDITFVDFHTAEGGVFGHEVLMNNCKFGATYNPVRFISTNKTIAKNVIVGGSNRIDVGGNGGSGIYIDKVSGISINSCKIIKDVATSTGSIKGVSIIGAVDSLFLNGTRFDGVDYSIQAFDTARLSNAIIIGCSLGAVYLGGSNNEFKGCAINAITLNGADSIDNVFDSGTRITNTISVVNSGNVSNQHFGGKRGTRSKTFYSLETLVPDGTTYDLVIPIPDNVGTTKGRVLYLFAGYSHQGNGSHWAQLATTVRVGNTTQLEGLQISKAGTKDIAILSVTQTAVTLRLTYQFAGVFSATVIG
jgi:hypothetical protein